MHIKMRGTGGLEMVIDVSVEYNDFYREANNWCLHTAPVHVGPPPAVHHEVPSSAAALPPSTHTPPQSGHLSLSAGSSTSANPSHQQELQAKILSLFNSGSGQLTGTTGLPSAPSQSHSYGSLGQSPSQNPSRPPMPGPPAPASQGYANPPGRMPVATSIQRPPTSASGINFDNPSVQKALDTLIQSGPSLNHLVSSGASQQQAPRPAPNMGQAPPVSMYPRHYWKAVEPWIYFNFIFFPLRCHKLSCAVSFLA